MAFSAGLGTCDLAEFCVGKRAIRNIELRGIEDVRTFRPELQSPAFREIEILEDRKVQRTSRRAVVRLQPDIALGERGRRPDICCVEPLARSPSPRRSGIGAAGDQIRPAKRSIADQLASAGVYRIGHACSQRYNAIHLPIAYQALHGLVQAAAVLLAAPERNFIIETSREIVTDVPRGIRIGSVKVLAD